MYLTPGARKRQQALLQMSNQRMTRQLDADGKKRQTLNSRNKTLHQELLQNKKSKLNNHLSSKRNFDEKNDDEEGGNNGSDSKQVDKENTVTETSNSNINKKDEENNNADHVALLAPDPYNVLSSNTINQKLIQPTQILGEGHLSILHAYVRDNLFKNIKILAPNHLETTGDIMRECLQLLKYSEAKNGNLTAFTNACRAEIRKTMCSRRGYVKRQTQMTLERKFCSIFIAWYYYLSNNIFIQTKEMILNDTFPMFDLELMNFFYNPDYETDSNVVNAWYIYVLKFLPLVNKKWREATAPDKLTNASSMFLFISISDEALIRWFLHIWVPILVKKKEQREEEKTMNKKKQASQEEINETENEIALEKKTQSPLKKARKQGPHDTNVKASIYSSVHHAITNARRNYDAAVRWNQIFWSEVQKRNNYTLETDNTCTKNTKFFKSASELPLPDLNENQEFLASYKVLSSNQRTCSASYDEDDNLSAAAKNCVPM
jgi:hypothetical protein